MGDTFMLLLDETCTILESYKGRDKIIRTLCYLSRLMGELQSNPEVKKKFSTFGSQMSATRTTLRLFDDLLVLKNSINYAFGKNEPDKCMAVLGITSNIVDHLFLPLEKVSWLAKHKLLTGVDNSKWDTASAACWVVTSYLTILKTLRCLVLLKKHENCLDNAQGLSAEKLQTLKTFHLWTLSRACLDFMHAVNTLPPGFLWSSKFKPWFVSLIGTSSSLLGLYLIIYKRWLK
ncbi:peroxisomal membrane protein 11C [Anthonomus grandis grandis]|uniref:peroxisomal membrane protein 11C n=1 Tax=Anthonomus grandis grandis TaxID=2921223 RepID=UPI002165B6EB|nr:peroxisomal membrane protein 11C [Anthonomus grandis grandis]